MKRIKGPMELGNIAYFSFKQKTLHSPYLFHLSPSQLLQESGKVPQNTKGFDDASQALFPTEYPAMVTMEVTENGPGTLLAFGRQLKQDELPSQEDLKKDHAHRFISERSYDPNCKWWSLWSETYEVDSYLFPISLNMRRALLSPGYILAGAIDIITLPVMWPMYMVGIYGSP
ncbi:hypothetical protein KP004_03700 [Geomonas oryzisoli]|uniref:Uncharacterized protein n=1 Tax=Geomonas oryzisoli TaxID=2847992 RepID=A0ABX8J784_9BACT|nr:hypothetical protein [Geomonas oryzisoli]QWV94300.1 hypothetical protein KP004_03700 [Geomonas oryzisoli]